MLLNNRYKDSPLLIEVKYLATQIQEQQNINATHALDIASQNKGFRNYLALLTSLKYGSIDSSVPLLFCCRCSKTIEEENTFDSTLSPVHKKYKLCASCFKKEKRILRKKSPEKDNLVNEILVWYETIKMTQIRKMVRSISNQKGISHVQAGEIVASLMGFPDYDHLLLEATKHKTLNTESRIKSHDKRQQRIQEKYLKEVVVVEKK